MSDKELVWLPKKLAEQVKSIESDAALNAMIDKHFTDSMSEIKAHLESLDDHVLQYKGLMAKAREAFKDASDDMVQKSYEVWEAFDEAAPSIRNKIDKVKSEVSPLAAEINQVNLELKSINTSQIERVLDLIERIGYLNDESKDMFRFLMNNF